MLQAKLVIVGGDDISKEFPLVLPARVGRGRENDIMLGHPLVSRTHCEIYESDGKLCVRDLGSLNGTYIGSDRIDNRPLLPGELLTIGTVTFRAIYGGYEEEAAREPLEDPHEITTVHAEDADTDAGITTVRTSGNQQLFSPKEAEALRQTVPLSQVSRETVKDQRGKTETVARTDRRKKQSKSD
jgi:predicted component of type VI protein secretion system